MKEISIYIHIPFCISKCYYCDFLSYDNKEEDHNQYVSSLIDEIQLYKEKLKEYKVKTIFIGGGTPTILNINIFKKLLSKMISSFNVCQQTEITVESNPGTLDINKLRMLRDNGVNRLSIGLQSDNDKCLKEIGRIHNYKQFLDNYNNAIQVGFNNINIDLMFGLPEQDPDQWLKTLENIADLKPKHISCYSLTLEQGTKLYELYEENKIKLPYEDHERKMYHMTKEYLRSKSYRHYEISNFAIEGYESRHNIVYWKCKEYVGIGLGAHSYYEGKRYHNELDIKKYMNKDQKVIIKNDIQIIDKKAKMEEYMFLGLRLMDGISKNDFKNRFNENIEDVYGKKIKKLVQDKLLIENPQKIRISDNGIDISNIIFQQFLL